MAAGNRTAEENIGEIRDELKALRDDLAALGQSVRDLGVQQANSVAGSVRDAVGQATESLRMSAGEARRQGEAVATEIEAAITRNPLTAILVAMGLGYIVGMISRR